jgi:hypothetical protein
MRRLPLFTLAPAGLLLLCSSAQAAETAELTVTGRVLPPSCTIALAGGTIAYGTLPVSKLNAAEPTAVTPWMGGNTPSDTLNIACDAPAQIAVQLLDNRAGTAAPGVILNSALEASATEIFGLGQDSTGVSVGAYSVIATEAGATVDGSTGKVITSTDGTSWADGSNVLFSNQPGWLMSWTAAASPASPEPVTTVAQTLNVNAAVVGTSALDTSTPVALDGSMTIELVYL